MTILIIHPGDTPLYKGLTGSIGMRIPRTDSAALVYDLKTHNLAQFKYRLRQSYHDVEAIIYISVTTGPAESDRLMAVAELASQQQVTLFVLTAASLLSNDAIGEYYRQVGDIMLGGVRKFFLIGQSPLSTHAAEIGNEIIALMTTSAFGNLQATVHGGLVRFSPFGRKKMFQPSSPDKLQVWIGQASSIELCLNRAHADMNAAGHFQVELAGQEQTLSFLQSPEEMMVTSEMFYFVKGERKPLIYLMLAQVAGVPPAPVLGHDE